MKKIILILITLVTIAACTNTLPTRGNAKRYELHLPESGPNIMLDTYTGDMWYLEISRNFVAGSKISFDEINKNMLDVEQMVSFGPRKND